MINTVYNEDGEFVREEPLNDIITPPFTDGQKEVIEAIEKHKEKCKEIEIKINKYGHKNICDVDEDITDIKELLNDTIKRIEEPTNYDWLRSLNTEEMAEFIRKQRDDWSDGWYSDCHPFSEIVEWLKQPHTPKE